jgi:hypothetical protein
LPAPSLAPVVTRVPLRSGGIAASAAKTPTQS